MARWQDMINEICEELDEKLIAITLSDEELKREFNDSYGGHEGEPFTAWTDNYVLFPVVYDGAEWVGYAPRNPCDIKTNHQGGE